MFIRQKKNKSGKVSIQVIDKANGKYTLAKTIGSSSDVSTLSKLMKEAEFWIEQKLGMKELDFTQSDLLLEQLIDSIQQIKIVGTELLLGTLFDEIGFNVIEDELFRKLVLARLCYPVSKLKTVDYLRRYEGYQTNEDDIYRYLDKLNKTQKRTVEQISYAHTLKVLNNTIQIVFYDVTTLYFEIQQEDTLRKTGFSKEGKHQNPQIVLGLLVSTNGYPLAYEIYEGKKFEGDTLLPVINLFKRKYKLDDLVIVADAGLLSNKNITSLERNNYRYILGARIKNEKQSITTKILSLNLKDGESEVIEKSEQLRLIINYSQARARKDKANREKGIAKLEKQIKTNKLTKAQINNKGYNKFLKMDGAVKISLDQTKIDADKKWDGLKGYLTNTALDKAQVIENYRHLWRIEKAFRVTKTDLKIRPIFHFAKRRIEAHICITFVAYKIYKELDRRLKELQSTLSPEKAIEIAKTIYGITATKPHSKQVFEKTLITNEEQRNLARLFNLV
ncbi:MAG: IS1634 family transposase [Bacteroidetes bacterium]|nr:IS1634 family transposase [Bacteroidota bacterium]